jgi:CRP-like cAMP-binding protein
VAANEDLTQMLAAVDIFREVPPKMLKRIADSGKVVDFAPGHEVTTGGSHGVAFHLVTDGSAEVEVGGRPRGTLRPGQGFGEISLIDGLPRSATVRAGDGGLQTFALSAWEFRPLLEENPTVAYALLKGLCARLRAAEAALDAS